MNHEQVEPQTRPMRFVIAPEVFDMFPNACFGLVVATGVQNSLPNPEVARLLAESVEAIRLRFAEQSPEEEPALAIWREAFRTMGQNPRRTLASVDALVSRVAKGNAVPSISPVVDLVNTVSLTHLLPLGAHDIDRLSGDMQVRLSRASDRFTPFGATESESVPPGEIVYADDSEVRTRMWVWRQGERAKTFPESSTLFFPIDSPDCSVNGDAVRAATAELADLVARLLGGQTQTYFLDKAHPVAGFEVPAHVRGGDTMVSETLTEQEQVAPQIDPDILEQVKLLLRGITLEGELRARMEAELAERLQQARREGRPLRVKLGVDPTNTQLHVGYLAWMMRLKQFQQLGHKIYWLIGTFTAQIGDPTGKKTTRPMLTEEQVVANAADYGEQLFHVLDRDKTTIVYNNDWYKAMTPAEFLRLAAEFTINQISERNDFDERLKAGAPVYMHELMYPVAQAYDSVVMCAAEPGKERDSQQYTEAWKKSHAFCDVELGGNDQLFNMMSARTLMERFGQPPQIVLTTPLIVGTDGKEKMSKSLGNTVGFRDDPGEGFKVLMAMDDSLIIPYFTSLTLVPMNEIEQMEAGLQSGKLHPRDVKLRLVRELITLMQGAEAAARGEQVYRDSIAGNIEATGVNVPPHMQQPDLRLDDLLAFSGLARSKSEARRLVEQKGIHIDDVLAEPYQHIEPREGMILRRGKGRDAKAVRLHLAKE